MFDNSNNIVLREDELFVVFRMPHDSDYHILIDNPDPTKEFEQYQFVIHPFDKNGVTRSKHLFADKLIKNIAFSFETSRECSLDATSKSAYLENADRLIEEMNCSKTEKVVLSRIHLIENDGVDLYSLFTELCSRYKSAFVYLLNIPRVGTWMGATPEMLIESNDGITTTVALAATQKVNGSNPDEILWNAKEIEEQAIIQRYIENQLSKAKLNFSKGQTHTSQAGNVYHLKTVYEIFNVPSTHPIVELLHPGPAICGTPKSEAFERITSLEGHDRAFYCGYLGLKTAGLTKFYVNLRCMQIFRDQFALYVGGGLTKDSRPEAEWEETVAKTRTLETAIQKSYFHAHGV